MPFAFLTGGLSMIGEGITRQPVARGWTLAATDIDLDLAHKVAAAAGGPPPIEAFMLDATKGAEAKELVHSLLAPMAPSTVLSMQRAACAASAFPRPISPISRRRCGPAFSTSISTAYSTAPTPCGPAMVAAKRGAIVSIAASRCLHGGPPASIYSAAKAAIIVFSQSLAQEVGRHGIRVNSIAPGNAEARRKSTSLCAARLAARRPAMMSGGRSPSCSLATPTKSPACLDVSGGSTLH
jgi:NAD(P)-dependent dehydrogenase (short-subunit alcohol dehydrogenase family)